MVITYHGDSYFKLQSGGFTLLVDPTNSRSFRGANVVVNTTKPSPVQEPEDESQAFWIDHQGEYEIGGVRVGGWHAWGDREGERTVYRLVVDDIVVVLLGRLVRLPEASLLEHLVGADVVIVAIGGKPSLGYAEAAKAIRQLEPGMVVPAAVRDPKPFLQELGQAKCVPEEKLVVKKKDIKAGALEVRCLKS